MACLEFIFTLLCCCCHTFYSTCDINVMIFLALSIQLFIGDKKNGFKIFSFILPYIYYI